MRKWFGQDPDKSPEFQNRYLEELKQAEAEEDLQAFMTLLEDDKRITLVFAAKDTEHNNAVALREILLTNRLPEHWMYPHSAAGPSIRRCEASNSMAARRVVVTWF